MDQLLESKKIRERDRLRAQDVKIKREREQEGEVENDEVFITSAYKAQQEELEKSAAVDKEEEGLLLTIWTCIMYANTNLFREIFGI